jgi:integration host factor subunit beta
MNKLELISTLKEKAHLTKSEAAEVIKIFFDSLSDSFKKGERVEIRGFCSFHIKEYTGRNPKTGQKVTIPPKHLPFFKCGKDLKERVDY